MDLLDTLRTTGAIREFQGGPIPDDVLYRILDTARFAPSGGNRQSWHVVVVRDADRRRQLRDLYTAGWYEYLAQASAGLVPYAPITDEAAAQAALAGVEAIAKAAAAGPGSFAEHLDQAPALLVVFADLRLLAALDKDADRYTFAGGASVYPFAWSVLLAARAEGVGGVITTMPIRREAGVKALFGAADELALAAVIALGVPVHQPTRLTRQRVESFTTLDSLNGTAFTG